MTCTQYCHVMHSVFITWYFMITAHDSKTLAGWLLYTANQLEQTLQIKLWQNDREPPNPPQFSTAKGLCYTVNTQ